ncbi:DoxX family protein [Streptomyces mirabilis]|uniref:DoxX family protein n=1 Tax=Streptomyces mirabilis TaxID=68239 RepID=UPI00368DD4CC
MFVGYVLVAVLVALPLVLSARGMVVGDERVIASPNAVRVGDTWRLALSPAKLAGALGLLAGIAYRPLGVAVGAGVLLFFAGAAAAHLRVKDGNGAVFPDVLVAAAAVPILFGFASV